MLSAVIRYDKSFKLVKNVHPKDKTTIIIDFSLNARGPQEDEIYASQSFYRNNIRRGNTLICENGDQNIHWGRKGLMKFFDISEKSIAAIIKDDINSLDRKYKNTHYAIFS